MNECFIMGKVLKEPSFKFCMSKKRSSVCKLSVKIDEKSLLIAIAYDSLADWIVRQIKQSDDIFLSGRLLTDGCLLLNLVKKL